MPNKLWCFFAHDMHMICTWYAYYSVINIRLLFVFRIWSWGYHRLILKRFSVVHCETSPRLHSDVTERHHLDITVMSQCHQSDITFGWSFTHTTFHERGPQQARGDYNTTTSNTGFLDIFAGLITPCISPFILYC